MKNSRIEFIFLIVASCCIFFSCGDDEAVSPVPQIEFLGLSKDTMIQSFFNNDTTQIAISFTDGDGDLNKNDDDIGASLFIKDLRTNELYDRFFLPDIPSNGSVTGEMFIRLFTTCCVFPENIPPCETDERFPTNELELELTLIDGSGNRSNLIRTPPITLLCN